MRRRRKRSAVALGVDPARAYPSVDAMIAAEASAPDGIEVVSVVTPNHMHYPQSAAFLEAGPRRDLRQAADHQACRCREAGEARRRQDSAC